MFRFKSDVLKMVAFCSVDYGRRALTFLHLRDGIIEACDGHTYVRRNIRNDETDNTEKECKVLLSIDGLKAAFGMAKQVMIRGRKSFKIVSIENSDGRTTLLPSGESAPRIHYPAPQETYPITDNLFPKETPEYTIAMNAEFIKRVAALSALNSANGVDVITVFKFYGTGSPIVFERGEYTGIIMPQRHFE